MTVAITRSDLSAADLREAAARNTATTRWVWLVCPTCRDATAHGRVCRANSGRRWRNEQGPDYERDGVVRCVNL